MVVLAGLSEEWGSTWGVLLLGDGRTASSPRLQYFADGLKNLLNTPERMEEPGSTRRELFPQTSPAQLA